jgi:multidrug resistance efflux pump
MEATKDENAVLFEKKQESKFQQLRALVEERISRTTPANPQTADVAGNLERLAALFDRGLLTREEFDTEKRALLSGSR